MKQFTVSETVSLLPDPDPSSAPVATLGPGDRVSDPRSLGDWSKVNAVDSGGEPRTGWLPSRFLKEIVGQTVRLHPEPMSVQFEVFTGTLETITDVANWRKVRVTVGGEIHVGWIDTNATADDATSDTSDAGDAVVVMADQLSLGVNEVFRDALLKAEAITRIDAAALAAVIDAEAAKTHGGQWDPRSFNSDSGAAGLTQFIKDTWLGHARHSTTLLNKVAKEKGLVTALDGVVSSRESELLRLRFDPELSIVSAAEFGVSNLKALDDAGLIPDGIGDDEKARFMYLAHHEGASGARAFLGNRNSNSFDKFAAQIGSEKAANLTAAAGGDVALAYRRWLNGYMDEHIVPARFRKPGAGPVVTVQGTRALETFDGPVIPIGQFGGHPKVVLETQQVLTRLGYLDPPADGKWGPVSNWGLKEFCEKNDLSLSEGFTRDIARALLNPGKTLPDVKPRGDWFDKVIAYMNQKGHWICRHPDAVNIVYVEGIDDDGRVNDDRPNVFNDLRVVFSVDESGRPIFQSWEGTTEPGTFWTMNPMNAAGAARIAFNQYKSWIVGTHMKGKASAHEALVQVTEVTVHRDLNKDFKRTNDRTDTGLFGINQHWGYDAPKDDLGNTSAGCLVGRAKSGHREFMAKVKADPRFVASPAYRFMAAILPGDKVMA